jgi:hypothetical protein
MRLADGNWRSCISPFNWAGFSSSYSASYLDLVRHLHLHRCNSMGECSSILLHQGASLEDIESGASSLMFSNLIDAVVSLSPE